MIFSCSLGCLETSFLHIELELEDEDDEDWESDEEEEKEPSPKRVKTRSNSKEPLRDTQICALGYLSVSQRFLRVGSCLDSFGRWFLLFLFIRFPIFVVFIFQFKLDIHQSLDLLVSMFFGRRGRSVFSEVEET
eukprot:CAMPEP_0178776200 /NCGR_PEP_ID=MMETSP0744-20121128/24597_1 /TAXON_ID=913974 /ORGANISM="Nitzschia punctata, Strain CCMP561" /LENGTH=133 /DNA_ID=CAMNT_0020433225 /DNA_START=78 /DNA_END=479 /DNA_ORIENTATION=-